MKLCVIAFLTILLPAAQAQQSVLLKKGDSLDVSCPANTQIDVAQPSRSRSLITCVRVCTVEIAPGGSGYIIYVNTQNNQGRVQVSSAGGWESALVEANRFYAEVSQRPACDRTRAIGWVPRD